MTTLYTLVYHAHKKGTYHDLTYCSTDLQIDLSRPKPAGSLPVSSLRTHDLLGPHEWCIETTRVETLRGAKVVIDMNHGRS